MDASVTVKLTRPITAYGKEVSEIELEQPDGGDIMEVGMPFLLLGDGSYTVRADVVGKYIVRLGGIPQSSVKKMHPADMMACQGAVLGFFGESAVIQKDSSSESTTSPGSGESSPRSSSGSQ